MHYPRNLRYTGSLYMIKMWQLPLRRNRFVLGGGCMRLAVWKLRYEIFSQIPRQTQLRTQTRIEFAERFRIATVKSDSHATSAKKIDNFSGQTQTTLWSCRGFLYILVSWEIQNSGRQNSGQQNSGQQNSGRNNFGGKQFGAKKIGDIFHTRLFDTWLFLTTTILNIRLFWHPAFLTSGFFDTRLFWHPTFLTPGFFDTRLFWHPAFLTPSFLTPTVFDTAVFDTGRFWHPAFLPPRWQKSWVSKTCSLHLQSLPISFFDTPRLKHHRNTYKS